MVVGVKDNERTDLLFHALADSTRRDIVTRAMSSDHSISGLAHFYDMSFAAVQKHVAVLERAGLITKHPRGREQLVRGSRRALRTAYSVLEDLEALWTDRVDRMSEILANPKEKEHDGKEH